MRVAFLIIPCLLIFTYCYPQEVTQSQLINSGDTIEIVIEAFNRPPLRETAEVSEEGEIYCPIIGNIKAEGLSVDKIKEAANAELKKKYFIDADINVEIKTLGKISLEKQRAQQRAKERAEKIGAILDNAHPYAIVGESYNDNIYLTDHDARSDFITTIRPGIKYYKKTSSDKKMDLFFDGSAEAKVYADNSKDNAINPH
ncbi:MAG: polysaccharide biosynthesis/export family protein, partial [Candidatus Omnitrophota bacterium]